MDSRTAILTAALLALAVKLACAALTLGTNDADSFYNFGRFISEHGLLAQYRATPEFNHTPLTGRFGALIYGLGHGAGFNFLLRVPGILADFAVVQALLRWSQIEGRPSPRALVLLALSPVSLMISGFHGNVDGVLVWLLVLAAIECSAGRPMWCGLWFGLACNVKIIPLLVAPIFFFHWFARERALRFFLLASVVISVGWIYPLVTIPKIFLNNVLGYGSNWGGWGITYWLGKTGIAAFAPFGFSGLTSVELATMSALKAAIVAAALIVAWKRRGLDPNQVFTTLTVVWTVFFAFAPGIGAQYLVWLAPFALVTSFRWWCAITAASSVFLFVFYNTICGGWPWDHGISTAELFASWAGWSNFPWLAVVGFLGALCCRAARAGGYSSSPSSSLSSSSSSGGRS
jgi:hypothetical protein